MYQVDVGMYARPVRIVAVALAVLAAVWGVVGGELAGGTAGVLTAIRVVEIVVAALVAVLASPRRPIAVLRALVFILAFDVAAADIATMAVVPTAAWDTVVFNVALMLGTALFAPWSWRWQLGLTVAVVGAGLTAVGLWVPPTVLEPWTYGRVVFTLSTLGGFSVLGSHLAQRERVRAAQSNARYRSLFVAAGDAIALLDGQGRVCEGNARLAALLGRAIDELVGQPLGDLIAATDDDGREGPLSLPVGSDEGGEILAGRLIGRANHGREVEIALARVPADRRTLFQAIIRDLTERRTRERREAEARRLDAVGRFAGGIAHQFNNLFAGILTQATLLRGHADAGENERGLDDIADAARRGEHLTKALLRCTPHYAVTTRSVRPATLLDRVLLTAAAWPTPVHIDMRARPDLPVMAADPDHLTDALLELVRNAAEAMGSRTKTPVIVAAAAEEIVEGDAHWPNAAAGSYIRLSVIDRGPGMDQQTKAQLFEPFFTTKPMHETDGLALAAVYWVARAHGGSISVDTEPGRGTSVHLLIPCAVPVATTGSVARASGPAGHADGPFVVLVVDDEEFIRDTAERALTAFGYEVLTAEDGHAGLAIIETADVRVDVAVLDVVMPGGGADLVVRARATRPALPILISSGYGPSGEVERMLEAGAAGFLQKPYELTELRDAVEAARTGRSAPVVEAR